MFGYTFHMDLGYSLVCFFIIAFFASMIVFRAEPVVKKYWGYTLIFIPLLVLIIMKKIFVREENVAKPGNISVKIQDLKDNLVEVQLVSSVEIAAAKTRNEETLKKLEEVKKIPDALERRKQLALLIG